MGAIKVASARHLLIYLSYRTARCICGWEREVPEDQWDAGVDVGMDFYNDHRKKEEQPCSHN